eukprot:PhF_6_TR21011/c2_g1_i1/m.30186
MIRGLGLGGDESFISYLSLVCFFLRWCLFGKNNSIQQKSSTNAKRTVWIMKILIDHNNEYKAKAKWIYGKLFFFFVFVLFSHISSPVILLKTLINTKYIFLKKTRPQENKNKKYKKNMKSIKKTKRVYR